MPEFSKCFNVAQSLWKFCLIVKQLGSGWDAELLGVAPRSIVVIGGLRVNPTKCTQYSLSKGALSYPPDEWHSLQGWADKSTSGTLPGSAAQSRPSILYTCTTAQTTTWQWRKEQIWRHLRKGTWLRNKYRRPWSDAAHNARRLIKAYDICHSWASKENICVAPCAV